MLSSCAAATAWSNGESKGSCSNPKPWHTPTVTEIPFDSLPTELRMLALGTPSHDRPEYRAEDLPF
jgi:hypothetical protein